MSAVEEIQRAIAKLTTQRDAGDIGSLDFDAGDATLYSPLDNGDALLIFRAHEDGIGQNDTPDPDTFALAELLVTLHRTIDAQLAFLNVELILALRGHSTTANHLALARAINGDAS